MPEDADRRAHALLARAMQMEPRERGAFIAAECAQDPGLTGRAGALLAAVEGSADFLEMPALSRPAHAPATIGRYRIVRVLGAGGMATVYEAVQESPSRRVALKVLREGLGRTAALERFRFETQVLARLRHAGIAQIFEAGTHEDGRGGVHPFFAMEFVEGARTITAFALGLAVRERLRLFASVCDAVQHGHQHGVIHRDLKPGNILVDEGGRPKVIDFGIARSADPEHPRLTMDLSEVVGTLHYMSPEQCAGRDLDTRTDVYSLGVILYELLCGRLPHSLSGLPLGEAQRAVRDDPPPRPSAVKPELRGDLEAILETALDKDRERRYATVAALATDIRRFLSDQPIEARPPTVMRRCRLFVRRHRVLVAATVAVVGAILAGSVASGAFAYRAWREAQRRRSAETEALTQRDAARRQAYTADIGAAFSAFAAGEYQELRSRLASAPAERRGWEWQHLSGIAEPSRAGIAAHDDMVLGMEMSMDGSRLVTAGADGRVRLWDSAGGTIASVDVELEVPGIVVTSVAFGPGGRIVAGSDDGGVRLFDASLTPLGVARLEGEGVESVAFAPGPEGWIIAAQRDGAGSMLDARTLAVVGTLADQNGVNGIAVSQERLATWNRRGDVNFRSPHGVTLRSVALGRPVSCAVFSRDGATLAVGGADGRITLLNAPAPAVPRELITSGGSTIRSLAFSPDDGVLACGSTDRGIVLCRLGDAALIAALLGHEEAVGSLAFGPRRDGRDTLYSASWDRTIRIWDVEEASPTPRVFEHEGFVYAVAFSPSGQLLASGSEDRSVRLWDPELALPVGTLRGHEGAVKCVAFSPSGELLASGSQDRTVRVWDTLTGAPGEPLHGGSAGIQCVAFLADGERLAFGDEAGGLYVCSRTGGAPLWTVRAHQDRINGLAISPDGGTIATASRDRYVRLFDAQSGALVREMGPHQSDIFAAVFGLGGKVLYSGSRDQTVVVWDLQTGRRLRTLDGHGQFVTSLALMPDGSRLAAGSWFGKIVLWDLADYAQLASFPGHARTIRAVAFSPDGRYLASGSYDRTVAVLDSAPAPKRRESLLRARALREAAAGVLAGLPGMDRELLARALDTQPTELREHLRKLILARLAGAPPP